MSTLFEMAKQITQAHAAPILSEELQKVRLKNGHLNDRIQQLEVALNRMICAHENTLDDSEGRYPKPDSGCIHCTKGTVPDRLNTGPCAYHNAQKLLGQI